MPREIVVPVITVRQAYRLLEIALWNNCWFKEAAARRLSA